jgi:DNA-binding MarR family transcriptional regulator
MKKFLPFIEWIIEVAENKIIEHRLLKINFNSQEEFIVFTIVWLRVYKKLFQKINNLNSNIPIDQFIKKFYNNQEDKYLGMTINAITRESNSPRTTVKRIVDKLIEKGLVSRSNNKLIIPTEKVRDLMRDYRRFTFKSHKDLFNLFNKLELNKKYNENDNF